MKLARYLLPAFLAIPALGLLIVPSTITSNFHYSLVKFITKKVKPTLFIPTLTSINALTMYNFSTELQENNSKATTIQELAVAVHSDYTSIQDGISLSINSSHEPTKYCSIYKGVHIPDKSPCITVYSRGFARESRPLNPTSNDSYYNKILNSIVPGFQPQGLPQKGGGAICAYATIRENLIHSPCISFDYPDTRLSANYAQTVDLQCLTTILSKIPQDKKIVQIGASRGATVLLKHELLNKTERHPAALVLESPFLSLKDTVMRLIKKTLYNIPIPSFLVLTAFNWLYPQYNAKEDNLQELLLNINKDVPIFIVHLKDDPYVSNESMFCLVNTLAQVNKEIHLLVLNDPSKKARHGKLNIMKPFQQAANAFYKKYELPCNEELATEGATLLDDAKKNAEASSIQEWIFTQCFEHPTKEHEFYLKDK